MEHIFQGQLRSMPSINDLQSFTVGCSCLIIVCIEFLQKGYQDVLDPIGFALEGQKQRVGDWENDCDKWTVEPVQHATE